MLAKKYLSKLVSISNPFEGIYTLEFESLGNPYKYHPGQFLHIALDDEYDGSGQWPDSRCFSMQSNPEEKNIRITYAVKGTFTQRMERILKVGSEVWLKLPYGELFEQQHDLNSTVFISGGTGITPYLSLFTNESFNRYKSPKIYLGFKSKSFNIYVNDLKVVSNSEVKISYFFEDINGVIDINQIFNENGKKSYYFISGPPTMIKSFKKKLIDFGVMNETILTDDWE